MERAWDRNSWENIVLRTFCKHWVPDSSCIGDRIHPVPSRNPVLKSSDWSPQAIWPHPHIHPGRNCRVGRQWTWVQVPASEPVNGGGNSFAKEELARNWQSWELNEVFPVGVLLWFLDMSYEIDLLLDLSVDCKCNWEVQLLSPALLRIGSLLSRR